MSADTPVEKKKRIRFRRTRAFWARVTEGLEVQQLWGQLRSEAKASYGLYSKDVDWEQIGQERSRFKRGMRSAWALFMAMLMKLPPARRVLLLLALLLLAVDVQFGSSAEHAFDTNTPFFGVLLLLLLLALELADRVTMKRDLEIAREIQQWLVPAHPPVVPGMDIAFATRPQNTVAGDYYDAFLRPRAAGDTAEPALLIAVADVAGKSVPAALLMATFQASLKALTATPATLGEIVVGLDRYCRAHSLEGLRFTTAFVAEIDPATREMNYVNAGHNDPILRHATGAIERLTIGGPPFGLPLFTDDERTFESGRVVLQPGDLLCIFTDGVIEAVDDGGQEYGETRLIACLQNPPRGNVPPAESAGETLARVMADVNTFVGYARQHDDITCFVLRISA